MSEMASNKTICFGMSSLGLNGRFGNQLFQANILLYLRNYFARKGYVCYATLRPCKNNLDTNFKTFFHYRGDECDFENDYGIKDDLVYYNLRRNSNFCNLDYTFGDRLENIIGDIQKCIDSSKNDSVFFDIAGYFQDYRYFENTTDFWKSTIQRWINAMRWSGSEMIACHLRFGDYNTVRPKHYAECSTQYYIQSLFCVRNQMLQDIKVPSDISVHVVSDSIEESKQIFAPFEKYLRVRGLHLVYEYPSNGLLDDFFRLAFTRGNIIANSSFSWMAAFLGQLVLPEKIVVFPKHWFGPENLKYHRDTGFKFPKWIEGNND